MPEHFNTAQQSFSALGLGGGSLDQGQVGGVHIPWGRVNQCGRELSPLLAGLVPEGTAGSAHHFSWKRKSLRLRRAPSWEIYELWEEESLSELGVCEGQQISWRKGPGIPRRKARRGFLSRAAKQCLLPQKSEMWTRSLSKLSIRPPNAYSS